MGSKADEAAIKLCRRSICLSFLLSLQCYLVMVFELPYLRRKEILIVLLIYITKNWHERTGDYYVANLWPTKVQYRSSPVQGSTGAKIAPLPHMMSSACIVMKRTPERGGEERNWNEEMCQVTGRNREVGRWVDENPCCHWEKLFRLKKQWFCSAVKIEDGKADGN